MSDAPARLQHRNRNDFFHESVSAAIARISRFNPEAFGGIEVGVDDVPKMSTKWAGERIPLAAALESGGSRPARIVLYQRPIELRAASSRQLQELVHRTIVDQLAALTGIPVSELDDDAD